MRPIRRHADGFPVELSSWRWIKRPRRPITDQNCRERDDLRPNRPKSQKKCEGITEPNLSERIFKGEIQLRTSDRSKEYPKPDQHERSPHRVENHLAKRLALRRPAGDRKRQRNAD